MNFFRKNLPANRRSQIAVIITFVIAVIFLFIAVFINLSKVSQIKTTTSNAADKAALGLASQLGSISHYYKDKLLKGKTFADGTPGECHTDWLALTALIIIGVATVLAAIFLTPASIIAGPLAVAITMGILSGISGKYKEMTGYNAFRESTLFQALASIQSDDVELKVKTPGSGIFYEDADNNGIFDATTEPTYNLSAIPEMRNEKKASRFAAWYYALRLPLVSDELMKNSLESIFLSRIKSFIDVDEWDSSKWKINKLSYVIKPGNGSRDYDVTCADASCPDWVKDPAKELLRIVRMDASDNVSGGFLKDKLISLLNRLEAASTYDLTFCDTSGCSDVNKLIEDLRMFLLRSKEVLNLPVSERFNYLTQWFPLWYDFKKHDQTDTDGDGNTREPANSADPNKYTYDIYLRLTRDQNTINTWIKELEEKNNTANTGIKDVIKEERGHNEFGQGATRASCATVSCCGHDCQTRCCDPAPCSFAGIYCTAFGGANPPVCVNGDLYGVKPNWCPLTSRSASCACSCSRNPQSSEICQFQGQLSWDNTSGQTEVEQAIRILRALDDDIAKIKMSIADMADKVTLYLSKDDAKRNEIVYAWKDKPKPDGSQQFSHFVKVKIDGYPNNFPYITESMEWGWTGPVPTPQKCRKLNAYQGDITITTWRYDQDQPTDIGGWKLRRRKKGPLPEGREFYVPRLNEIVSDIQDNAQIDYPLNKEGIEDLLTYFDFAISSSATVHYSPEKNDIKIIRTEGD